MLFWALDRLSREGVLETLQHLNRLESYGVGFRSYTEPFFDSCGVFKDAVISILATLATQEQVKRSERTKAGLAVARAKQLGRRRLTIDPAGNRFSTSARTITASDCPSVGSFGRIHSQRGLRRCVINVFRNGVVSRLFLRSASAVRKCVLDERLIRRPNEFDPVAESPNLKTKEAPCRT